MRKTILAVLALLLTAGVIGFVVARQTSLERALRHVGYDTAYDELFAGFDNNDDRNLVLRVHSDAQPLALATATQNKAGFWALTPHTTDAESDSHQVACGWMRSDGWRQPDLTRDPTFGNEWHLFYCGDNATGPVAFLPGQLPEGVAASIRQSGSDFSIHLVSFGEPEVLNEVDMQALLLAAGCIGE